MLLLRESLILHKMKHPAIVKFYGINFHAFENDDKLEPTFITEYLPHGSLKQILEKEQCSIADDNWSPTKKYICLLGIADAMRYLHHKGVVHRDLKPENILVDEYYYPRICDFGLSRYLTNSSSSKLTMTTQIGTPLYMAPELMEDEKYGPAVDVYAFAILAFEIVTREIPFSERGNQLSFIKLSRIVLNGDRPQFKQGANEKMKDLISQCWSQNEEDRPTFDQIFDLLSKDFSYFDEDVDEIEINDYLETLKEESEEVPPSLSGLDSQNLEKLKKDNEEANNKIKAITDESQRLKKDNEAMNKQLKDVSSENHKLKNDNEKMSKLLNNANDECKQLKIENDAQKEQIKKLQDTLIQQKKQLDQLQNTSKQSKNSTSKSEQNNYLSSNMKIVIDNGSSTFKAGFSGDDYPKLEMRSALGIDKFVDPKKVTLSKDSYIDDQIDDKIRTITLKYPIEHGTVTYWDYMEWIWHYTFFNKLRIDPSENPVIISEITQNPLNNKEKMVQIMFETFNVPCLSINNQSFFSLLASGRKTGINIQLGGGVSQIVPFYESRRIKTSTQKVNFGGKDLDEYMTRLMTENGFFVSTTRDKIAITDMKEKHCYVAYDFHDEINKSSNDLEVTYNLNGVNTVLYDQRFRCPEVYFQPNLNGYGFEGIHILTDGLIKNCSKNYQNDLYKNVVLTGASSMFEGLPERFEKELKNLAPNKNIVKVIAPPERKNFTWKGGSIFGCSELFNESAVLNSQYKENGFSIFNDKPY